MIAAVVLAGPPYRRCTGLASTTQPLAFAKGLTSPFSWLSPHTA